MTDRDDSHRDAGSDDQAERTFRWTPSGESGTGPSQTVVEAVATLEDRDPSRLRPLYQVVDPEGLDALFEPNSSRSRQSIDGHVTFRFEGSEVTVHSDGRVVVSLADDGPV
jgi:hypothetical protein